MDGAIKGRISSFQTLGTLDGPGVRFVVFMQGCPLRCACCHNPETWNMSGGKEYTAAEVVARAERYREYFGNDGGITLSGGEPLMQPEFAAEVLKLCREKGIGTCLDTSGCFLDEKVKKLLEFTDYCMLDIKYTTDEKYRKYAGCAISQPLEFLDYLNTCGILTRIRQVIIPGLNDGDANLKALAEIIKAHPCIEKTELLAFRKLCASKYQKLGITFPLAGTNETTQKTIAQLQERLENYLKSCTNDKTYTSQAELKRILEAHRKRPLDIAEILSRADSRNAVVDAYEFFLRQCDWHIEKYQNNTVKNFLYSMCFEGYVANGGISVFLYDNGGTAARKTADALHNIGALEAEKLLKKSFLLFPDSVVPENTDERRKTIEKLEKSFFSIDVEAYNQDVESFCYRYLISNKEQILNCNLKDFKQ